MSDAVLAAIVGVMCSTSYFVGIWIKQKAVNRLRRKHLLLKLACVKFFVAAKEYDGDQTKVMPAFKSLLDHIQEDDRE